MNGLALCTGSGGLEAALHILFPEYRAVCAVERQAYAAASFVAWLEKTGLGACPVWDDVTTFDPMPWCGLVDILTAGYPCQPFSNAGKRQGENDPRHLWPFIFRHIRALMPPFVFCENVAAHLTRGFDAVRGNLERIGYKVAAGIFSAAEVGAPHLRERLFILGQLENTELHGQQGWDTHWPGASSALLPGQGAIPDANGQRKPQPPGSFPEGRGWSGNGGSQLAHAQSLGRPQGWPESAREQGRPGASGCGSGMGDTDSVHSDRRADIEGGGAERGTLAVRPSCAELGNAVGSRREGQGTGRSTGDGCFAWPWPAGRGAEQYAWEKPRLVKSGMGGTAHGVGARSEQLLCLGNGVVPVAGALAFVALWRELNAA